MNSIVCEKLNKVLSEYGFISNNKGRISNLGDGPSYFDIHTVERYKTSCGGMSERCSVVCFDIGVTIVETGGPLNARKLNALSEQADRLAKLLKRLEAAPVTFFMDSCGNPVDRICSECKCWTDHDDNGYGTCRCEYSSAYECRTMGCHVCHL